LGWREYLSSIVSIGRATHRREKGVPH
jgi:hypothetical protein